MDAERVVNVASVPHRSIFRYPGGKTWLVPHIRAWLRSRNPRPKLLCEPFCGGAIVALSAVFENIVDEAIMVELDQDVASVWEVVFNGHAEDLVSRIGSFQVSHESVKQILDGEKETLLDRAFATILRNRMQRGGILASGASMMKQGENGRGLSSRWYASTLQRRIRDIQFIRNRVQFLQRDGIEVMREYSERSDAVFFIDPPYTVAGRRLYTLSEIDHEVLFIAASSIKGDFLMTYDDAPQIRQLAHNFGFDTQLIPMKNTHHRIQQELLVGRNLGWVRVGVSQPQAYSLLEL